MKNLSKIDNSSLVIITGRNRFIGQTRKPWVAIDSEKFIKRIESSGLTVDVFEFDDVINSRIRIKDRIVFYSFSQRPDYRQYIKDAVYYLSYDNNYLIPNFNFLMCHENKGFQELFKKQLGIKSLDNIYLSGEEELNKYNIEYPIVLKTVDGSNGKGVFLINNEVELLQKIRKYSGYDLLTKLDLIRRRYFRRRKNYELYPDYENRKDYEQYKKYVKKEKNFILQKFIPGLTFDFRAMTLFDKYYIAKRHTRANDFRASGAKLYNFDFDAGDKLLNYVKELHEKFNSPFLSADIGYDGKEYHLFEYQAMHFGINPFMKNRGYYYLQGGIWKYAKKENIFEYDLADGLVNFIRSIKGFNK